jgi:enoyl-CoA hydratase
MGVEVRVETDGGVARLTVSHPERRNALNLELSAQLVAAVDRVVADPSVGAVVVTGEPPAFCAGGDLDELARADADTLRRVYAGFRAVERCPLPTLAAVNGPAVGAGLNLALACDVRLAGPKALFDARFLDLGIHPGGGYTWMVQRALGPAGAAALTLFGERLDAAEAVRTGLAWRAYDTDDELLAAAHALAGRATAGPPAVVRATKASLRAAAGLPGAAEALEIEIGPQAESLRAPEFRTRAAKLLGREPA